MTSRRVNIGLTYATNADHVELLTKILQRLKDIGADLTGTNVHAFNLDEDDDSPTVYEVHDLDAFGHATLLARFTDLERADTRARQASGVVVELPVIADYRKQDN